MKKEMPGWVFAVIIVVVMVGIGAYFFVKSNEGTVGSVAPPRPMAGPLGAGTAPPPGQTGAR